MFKDVESEQNTHDKGDWSRMPLLQNNVDKKSVSDARSMTEGHNNIFVNFSMESCMDGISKFLSYPCPCFDLHHKLFSVQNSV